MGLPQLVGLECACCEKTISSITEGTFCSQCGNPVHLASRRPAAESSRDGRCTSCGGEFHSPIALEVKARQKKAARSRLVCPNCGSSTGFRPFHEDSPSLNLLPNLLFTMERELQCAKCDFVFRPSPDRARESTRLLFLLPLVVNVFPVCLVTTLRPILIADKLTFHQPRLCLCRGHKVS